MKRKQRDRMVITYGEKEEVCGSLDMAMQRYDQLAKKNTSMRIALRVNGIVVKERIPLIVNDLPVIDRRK